MMTVTPGPGNLAFMAMASHTSYRQLFPLIMASQIGFLLINLSVVFGLGKIMVNNGVFVQIFKLLSMGYMAYLAYRIIYISIKPPRESNTS